MKQLRLAVRVLMLAALTTSYSRSIDAQSTIATNEADQPAMFLSGNAVVEYPDVLRSAGIEGTVSIELRIDTAGRLDPGTLRFLKKGEHAFFDSAVRGAVETWRWSPARSAGRPVTETKQYHFTFTIARWPDYRCPAETIEHQVICSRPPRQRSAYGLYRGYQTIGFEAGGFVPCPDSTRWLPPELRPAFHGAHSWGNYTPDAVRNHPSWDGLMPDVVRGTFTYFVIGRGTLRGPGSFGHLGVGDFLFVFDTVMSVHPAVPDACTRFRAPSSTGSPWPSPA
jgi:TonB family protein